MFNETWSSSSVPIFSHKSGGEFSLIVDHPNKSKREYDNSTRFAVIDSNGDSVYGGNSIATAIKVLKSKRKNPVAKRKRNPAKNCSKNERFVTFSDGREVCFPASPKRKRKRKPAKKRTVRRVTRTTKVTYSSAKKKKKPAIRSSKPVTIPKGKRKGDHFTKNGKHYTVVSYIRDGKRMRFARLVGSKCAVKKSGGRRRNPVLTNPRKKRLTKAAYLKEVKRLANENLPYIRSEKLNSYINNDVDNSPIYRKSENHELILKYSDFPGRFEEIFLEDEIADRLAEDGPEGILDDKAYHAMSEDVEALVYALSQRGR
jgi:hypothetical protein